MLDQIVSLAGLNGTFDLGYMFLSRRGQLKEVRRKPSDFKINCKAISLCIDTWKLLVHNLWRCLSRKCNI